MPSPFGQQMNASRYRHPAAPAEGAPAGPDQRGQRRPTPANQRSGCPACTRTSATRSGADRRSGASAARSSHPAADGPSLDPQLGDVAQRRPQLRLRAPGLRARLAGGSQDRGGAAVAATVQPPVDLVEGTCRVAELDAQVQAALRATTEDRLVTAGLVAQPCACFNSGLMTSCPVDPPPSAPSGRRPRSGRPGRGDRRDGSLSGSRTAAR